jgi:aspartate kinase
MGLSDVITAKLGGTLMSEGGNVKTSLAIIRSDPRRRCVVVSAPGKRFPKDHKVTALFIALAVASTKTSEAEILAVHREFDNDERIQHEIVARFREIASSLHLQTDVEQTLNSVWATAKKLAETQQWAVHSYLASRGEWLMAQIVAESLGFEFVDADRFITFGMRGDFKMKTTESKSRSLRLREMAIRGIVVPGFYGATSTGRIQTFSRGGSDITGAIVANLTDSSVYENWTDVAGIFMADPRIVSHPRLVSIMSYIELRELSYRGATVFHADAVEPVRSKGIPIHVRSFNDPENAGTMIVATLPKTPRHRVTGIAGKKGFTAVTISKRGMNDQINSLYRIAGVFARHRISVDHCPGDVDSLSFIVESAALQRAGTRLMKEIERVCKPDRIDTEQIMLICTVGVGMTHTIGIAADLYTALRDAGVDVVVQNQGARQINIVVGVKESDGEKAIQALYAVFST